MGGMGGCFWMPRFVFWTGMIIVWMPSVLFGTGKVLCGCPWSFFGTGEMVFGCPGSFSGRGGCLDKLAHTFTSPFPYAMLCIFAELRRFLAAKCRIFFKHACVVWFFFPAIFLGGMVGFESPLSQWAA